MPLKNKMLTKHYFSTFKEEAFRLELLPHYDVADEKESFERFRRGTFVQDEESVSGFCALISDLVKKGRKIVRVHVIPQTLTPYLQFEISTGYLPQSKAGSQIHLISRGNYETLLPKNPPKNDFWLFDNSIAIEIIYDAQGRFIRENLKKDADKYRELKNRIIEKSILLEDWLKSNKESLHA